MLDFGGDASNGKCQVRQENGQQCWIQSEFVVEQNAYTTRAVCTRHLPDAVTFCTLNGRSVPVRRLTYV